MLSECYMLSGQFDKAYKSFKDFKRRFSPSYLQQNEMGYLKQADQIINMFGNIGYDYFNAVPNSNSVVQSIERADETYPECDFAQSIMECMDGAKREQLLSKIELKLSSQSVREREEANFTAGYLFFSSGEYETSFNYYFEAVKLSPNKALYYGYAANAMFKLAIKHAEDVPKLMSYAYISSKFARQAIELDNKNPRWHFYQHLALMTLLRHNCNYIVQAAIELEQALRLCRVDQVSLREAIVMSMNNLAKTRDNLRNNGVELLPADVLNRIK